MNIPLPTPGQQGRGRNWPRRLANAAVAVAVVAVAGATFVLSYSGVRAIAITGGVSPDLARVYPGVFDAVLVIACVAAILLRDARWWARAWAWVVVVVLLAAIGATDMLHAMSYTLRHRPTEGIVAAAPVAAVLLAFSLLLTLLRQPRNGAAATAGHRAGKRQPDALPAIAAGVSPRLPAPPIALPAAGDATRPEVAVTREEPALEGLGAATQPVLVTPEASEAPEAAPETAHEPTEASEVISLETPSSPSPPSPPSEAPRQVSPAIRYASSALSNDYWEADDDRQFAGQVYPDPRAEEEPGTVGFAHDADDPTVAHPFTQVRSFNRVRSAPTPPADDED